VGQAIVPAAAFQAARKTLSTGDRSVFFGFVSCRYRDGKPEKFVKGRASRLKAGCSQDWLPHKRAKVQSRAKPALQSL